MGINEQGKETKLRKYIKAPIRILTKVRDFYIKGMTECSDKVSFGTVMGVPTGQVNPLPRSCSLTSTKSSGEDDLRELIRIASTRRLGDKIELDLLRRQQVNQSPTNIGANKMPRSHSVCIGRIDEETPCEFGEDNMVRTDVVPRSRSYAVSKRTGRF